MDTEHQNPKTQLPRVIEEKPIVYDDEQLEEVREVATLPPIQLSPDEIEYAISLFARGFTRGDVVIGPVRLGNRTIGVNLAIFHDIFSRCRPYGAQELEQTRFYTDAEEIPKQINPTGLKRVSGASKVYG